MSLNRTLFTLALLIGATIGNTDLQAQNKYVADKIVAVVGRSVILYSDVDALSKELLRKRREEGYTLDRSAKDEALENLLLQKLLYHQSQIDSLKVNTDDLPAAVESAINAEVMEKGSVTALEAFYHKPIFDIKAELQRRYEEVKYARGMQSDVQSKTTITPGEVEIFYKKAPKDSLPIIPEQYTYSQIVKYPPTLNEAKQRTREKLLEMRERISKGARFDALARMYSEDPGSAVRGGEMDFTPKEGYVKPFADALARLNVNQVSGVVETEYGFHIIQLLEKKGNMFRCRHILIKPQFTNSEIQSTLNTLDSIANLVREGKMTFEAAATEYSEERFSRLNNGVVTNHETLEAYNAFDPKLASTMFFKEDLSKDDFQSIRNLKPGEVSTSYMTHDLKGNVMCKVVAINKITPAHTASLEKDYLKIEEIALNQKRNNEFDAWLNKKIASMYIHIDPEFRNAEFTNKAWLK